VDGEEREVPIDEVQVGDVMVVRPGEKIPTDQIPNIQYPDVSREMSDVKRQSAAQDLLYWAASVEVGSEHPLGKAVVRKAEEQEIALGELTDFEALRGKGVRGVVDGKNVLVGSRALLREHGVDITPLLRQPAETGGHSTRLCERLVLQRQSADLSCYQYHAIMLSRAGYLR